MVTLQHIRKDALTVSTWAGGTTTQLWICPEDALYAERNFLFRISSATIDLEESSFTALPDYERLILTLKGSFSLVHNQASPLHFEALTPHRFDGGWDTTSFGRVTDFNLMLRKEQAEGEISSLLLPPGAKVQLSDLVTNRALLCRLVLAVSGTVSVQTAAENCALAAGDLARLTGPGAITLTNETNADAVLAVARVSC